MASDSRGQDVSGGSNSLPADIRDLAIKRLGLVAGIIGAGVAIEAVLSHGASYLRSDSYPLIQEKWDLVGVAIIVAVSFAAFVALRMRGWSTSARLWLGVVYLIAISYLLSFTDHADHFWQGGHGLHGVPAVVIPILMFPVLSEAHAAGLIHRDIKPANIMLVEQGGVADEAKVLDFGLVKKLEGAELAPLTRADSVAGTPQYLAPEMITTPDSVDARCDIYSLGAVGYFLLTGEHVFGGATVVEVCAAHLHERPIAPSERAGTAVAADLEGLILDCLAKDPKARPQSANALRERLASLEAAGTWSQDDAQSWWEGYRQKRSEDAAEQPVRGSAATLEIELGGRASTSSEA